MSDETSSNTPVLTPVAADLSRLPGSREADRFGYFLLVAAALHAMAFVGFNSSDRSRLGAPGGAEQAISVSLITAEDLQSRATVDDAAAGQPAQSPPPVAETPPVAPPAAAPPLPPEEPAEEASAEGAKEAPPDPPPVPASQPAVPLPADAPSAAAPIEKPETTPEKIAKAAPEGEGRAIPALREAITDLPPSTEGKDGKTSDLPVEAKAPADPSDPPEAKPDPKAEPREAEKPKESAKPKAVAPKPRPPAKSKTAALDVASPPIVFAAPKGGGGAGVQRPAGITRSGENDDFARGVIRALQRTMPYLRDATGRVTVRILLDKNGNLASTTVVRPSRVSGMDQSVVFATHQSSFPLPPLNANAADLIFLVTYIYR